MSKKVALNGIEILTNEDDSSALSLLAMVEAVIEQLESDLDQVDENFHVFIDMDFVPNHRTKHKLSLINMSNGETRGKVLKILRKTTNSHINKITGTVRVDLQVKDR